MKLESEAALAGFAQEGCIPLSELTSPEALARADRVLAKYGMLVVTGVLSAEQRATVKANIVSSTNRHFGTEYPGLRTSSTAQLAKRLLEVGSATGLIAAKQTGMLHGFPFTKKTTPTIWMAGHQEPMDLLPWYSEVNLQLMQEHPLLAAFLACLGTDESGVNTRKLSEDSVKVAVAKNPATPPHIDHYSLERERLQCVLHVEGGAQELGYLPTTEELRAALHQRFPQLFAIYGFLKFPEDNEDTQLLMRYCVAPPPGSAVLWISGVLHAEQQFGPVRSDGLRRPGIGHDLSAESVRLYIGTHATDLPVADLAHLAVLANGTLPIAISRFHSSSSSRSPVQLNKMSTGSTGAYNVW